MISHPTSSTYSKNMDKNPASTQRSTKRLRSNSGTVIAVALQSDSHTLSSPISSDYEAEDDAYGAPPPTQQPRRRGRKPGTLSRASREAQRKTNHSLIEKARRTKINDALASLRELVPSEYKRVNEAPAPQGSDDDDDEEEPKKNKGKKSKAGEKEFKLEILVRTVAYLQDLTEKVKLLEENGCLNCNQSIRQASPDSRGLKRRRQDLDQAEEEEGARTQIGSTDNPPSRLPSISTWLTSPSKAFLLTPSQSPSTKTSQQLPTPPSSATFTASSVSGVPPLLTLPSPSAFLPKSGTQLQPCFSGFIPRRSSSDTPVYTPEDETAASLLLRISTSVTSPQLLFKPAHPSESSRLTKMMGSQEGRALTPSRLLGLTAGK